ncbi:MAG TPA: dihydrodipicolinate synthase family protein [Terriglobia bacterium]|nr:dihydrodipicolinate synthase family protein [Terriglobia bacterium]
MSRITPEQVRRRLDKGLVPAVPVPFSAEAVIDLAAQERYIAYMKAQPIAGVAVWAHTGRGLRLTREQRLGVLQAWSEGLQGGRRSGGRIIVAGVGGSSSDGSDSQTFIQSALEMARDALAGGAHCLLVHPPARFRSLPQADDLVFDYHRQLASLRVPLILFYLYEDAGGIAYSPGLLRRLLAIPEVVGVKLATLDSVMTFQFVANLVAREFRSKLVITGEDRFLPYSFMCGAHAALIGMGSACTAVQVELMRAWFGRRPSDFLKLAGQVERLAQVTFVEPMEGYIRRMLWVLVHSGVIDRESASDPWGPELDESEFVAIGKMVRALGGLPSRRRPGRR